MKKQLSSFDITRLVLDMQKLVGAYLNKSYQLSKNELILRFNIPGAGKSELYINSSGQMYLTSGPRTKPDQPGTFAMVLRKHLKNSRVAEIKQHDFDRIIVFKFAKMDDLSLVLELFGEGNAVLIRKTEEGNTILNALFQRSFRQRTLRTGREYQFPSGQVIPSELNEPQLKEILLKSKADLVRALAKDVNLGGLYAEEVCFRLGLNKNLNPAELEPEQFRSILNVIKQLFEQVVNEPEPNIVFDGDSPVDAVPIKLKKYDALRIEDSSDLSESLENFFSSIKDTQDRSSTIISTPLTERKAKLERQLQQQKGAIEKYQNSSKENKIKADSIYQNYQICEALLNEVQEIRKKYDWDEILEDELITNEHLHEFNPHDGSVKVKLPGSENGRNPGENNAGVETIITLDFRLNVNQNAEKYYEAAKVARNKAEGARTAYDETRKILDGLEDELAAAESLAAVEKESTELKHPIRKDFWFEKFRWMISSEGFLVIAGYDASSNEKVVKKYLRQGDRYAHADLHGAPSAIVRRKEDRDEPIPETTLNEACEFSVIHSKAWSSGLGAASAYWVNADQVSKTPAAGEFLSKGAFVIRGKRNYVSGIELKAALGEIEFEGINLVMCGPLNAVKSKTGKYIILQPGNSKKTDISKRISSIFQISVDEVMKILPPGNMDIIEGVGIELI